MLFVDELAILSRYAHDEGAVVQGVSFCLGEGQSLAIVGESGSGKSMIVDAIVGVLADNCRATGKIVFDGVDLLQNGRALKKALGRQIVFVPQGGSESLNPSRKIKVQLYEALARCGVRKNRAQMKSVALCNLAKAGLCDESVLEKYPFEISGGQAQRVVLATALSANAKLIVADEATRGIDDDTARIFLDCLQKEFKDSAKIFVTHDINLAKTFDKILVVKDGRQVEYGFAEDVVNRPQNAYTAQLVQRTASDG